jgi:hypothetical protein
MYTLSTLAFFLLLSSAKCHVKIKELPCSQSKKRVLNSTPKETGRDYRWRIIR